MPGVKTISPVDGSIVVERAHASDAEIGSKLTAARAAQRAWATTGLAERAELASAFVDALLAHSRDIARELTLQMGRPIAQAPSELRGFEERARYMIDIAEEALSSVVPEPKPGFVRQVRREPLGVVLTLAPWNYPFLTAVNSVVPAIMAGNAVILKHSEQTPLCAERLLQAFEQVRAPSNLFQIVHCTHEQTARMVAAPEVDFVAFTGSVDGGHAIVRAAAERFIGLGLELGGKDPAYVRADADLDFAVETLVDGAFFNSGQSCCGIERIYVHRDLFQSFVDGFVTLTRGYRLGNPLDPDVNLGPVVRDSAADHVRSQIAEATAAGARALIDPASFEQGREQGPYLAPQVLIDVDHSMRVMTEESFGPVVGIMPVSSDDEAVHLMNDSEYGLTASVWTRDLDAAYAIGTRTETGTFFMNRCDYLDPALAWTGVKNSGRGCTLSKVGYEVLTRPKSFHMRLP